MADDEHRLLKFERALAGRSVLVTGHTGFTGGWLCLWLTKIGARVTGLGLSPETHPNLFTAANIEAEVSSVIGDIRDADMVRSVVNSCAPAVIFHLAAQPLVSRAFDDPLETFASNILGTAHVLEAARHCVATKAVVCVTTDKVYADQNWHWGYRESDRLGGKDPYSASKAAAELVAMAYQTTLAGRANGVAIATARGGNIIGGGDWSRDRIVPDFVRALVDGHPLTLRNPMAIRPWQHVLALVHGYMVLAARLLEDGTAVANNWNFGPRSDDAHTVRALVDGLSTGWRRPPMQFIEGTFPETRLLHVDSTKSRVELDWRPPITFSDTVKLTREWYRDFHEGKMPARSVCLNQISTYRDGIRNSGGGPA